MQEVQPGPTLECPNCKGKDFKVVQDTSQLSKLVGCRGLDGGKLVCMKCGYQMSWRP